MASMAHQHFGRFMRKGRARQILGHCPVGSFFMFHIFLSPKIGYLQPKAPIVQNFLDLLPNSSLARGESSSEPVSERKIL